MSCRRSLSSTINESGAAPERLAAEELECTSANLLAKWRGNAETCLSRLFVVGSGAECSTRNGKKPPFSLIARKRISIDNRYLVAGDPYENRTRVFAVISKKVSFLGKLPTNRSISMQ
jgi:hypothetical protein